jgi:hypothetical protein
MLRNRSLPGSTDATVPTGSPLGKMRSPPLVMTVSPGLTGSSLMMYCNVVVPFDAPFRMPCSRESFSAAPTPLN